jgi:hypothetical protein
MSHEDMIKELKRNAATKSELKSLRKELNIIKWAFTSILGILLAIIGWFIKF